MWTPGTRVWPKWPKVPKLCSLETKTTSPKNDKVVQHILFVYSMVANPMLKIRCRSIAMKQYWYGFWLLEYYESVLFCFTVCTGSAFSLPEIAIFLSFLRLDKNYQNRYVKINYLLFLFRKYFSCRGGGGGVEDLSSRNVRGIFRNPVNRRIFRFLRFLNFAFFFRGAIQF